MASDLQIAREHYYQLTSDITAAFWYFHERMVEGGSIPRLTEGVKPDYLKHEDPAQKMLYLFAPEVDQSFREVIMPWYSRLSRDDREKINDRDRHILDGRLALEIGFRLPELPYRARR